MEEDNELKNIGDVTREFISEANASEVFSDGDKPIGGQPDGDGGGTSDRASSNNGDEDNKSSEKVRIPNEILEAISIDELLAFLSPDAAAYVYSPSLFLAKKAVLSDLDKEEAKQIEKLFHTVAITNLETKKRLWSLVIKQYFPDTEAKVSPIWALLISEAIQLTAVMSETRNYLEECGFVKGKKASGDKDE